MQFTPGAPFSVGDSSFKAIFVEHGDGPSVELQGTLSSPRPEDVLGPFFHQIHARLLGGRIAAVRVDLRSVEFMNSASFKSFLNWLAVLQGGPEPYRIVFVVDKKRRWQATSVHALRCFAPDLVEMVDQPRP